MPTTFLLLYRQALIWWAAALLAPFEPVCELVEYELDRRTYDR